MRHLSALLLGALLIVGMNSCRKKATDANVTVEFENYVDNQRIEKDGAIVYTNAAGNKYNVSLLKYYITNIIFIDNEGNEVSFKDHDLIDAFGDNRTASMNLPSGNYVRMKFLFGVDEDNNTRGDQAGDLDPSFGMLWTWNTGYIFSKHEGKFIDGSSAEQNLSYHLGKQPMATDITIDLGNLEVADKDQLVRVRYNLNNMYNNPIIDFNNGGNRHSMPSQTASMDDMKANLNDVFSFSGVSDL